MNCPMCKKKLTGQDPACPYCRCDVSLLVDYVDGLEEGLKEADAFTRKGELGEAIWAYLGVLEVDPDNATARQQVGKVVSAVRQFDLMSPGRRRTRRSRFHRFMDELKAIRTGTRRYLLMTSGLVLLALILGIGLGYWIGKNKGPVSSISEEKEKLQERLPC